MYIIYIAIYNLKLGLGNISGKYLKFLDKFNFAEDRHIRDQRGICYKILFFYSSGRKFAMFTGVYAR